MSGLVLGSSGPARDTFEGRLVQVLESLFTNYGHVLTFRRRAHHLRWRRLARYHGEKFFTDLDGFFPPVSGLVFSHHYGIILIIVMGIIGIRFIVLFQVIEYRVSRVTFNTL